MGWTKKTRDTGWRNINDEIAHTVLGGRAAIKRDGNVVKIAFEELDLDTTGNISMPRLPYGFRPTFRAQATWYYANSSIPPQGTLNISPTGYFNVYNTDERAMVTRVEFETTDPWPSTYPGIEVQL